jgi:hypothetical protein
MRHPSIGSSRADHFYRCSNWIVTKLFWAAMSLLIDALRINQQDDRL